MDPGISIWSPVIISSLIAPRTCRQIRRHKIDFPYKDIHDPKIKNIRTQVERKGKMAEVRINMELVAMAEDEEGRMSIISRSELIKERLNLREFDRTLPIDKDIQLIMRLQDLKWDGELYKNELIINYSISYTIIAVEEQVVKLYRTEESIHEPVSSHESAATAELYDETQPMAGHEEQDMDRTAVIEVDRMRNDNEELTRQLHFYEMDLMSLRHGIKKAEQRNIELGRELKVTRETVRQLQETISRQDLLLCKYKNHSLNNSGEKASVTTVNKSELPLGRRIKRMFMNSE